MVMRAGCSLIEAIVAMTLLAIGVLGVAAGGLLAVQLQREAERQETATNAARMLLDSLVLYRVHGTGSLPAGRYHLDWSAGADTVVVGVDLAGATFTLHALR